MTRPAPAPALETRNLRMAFGGIVATDDVSFRLETGARHALIGPNSAGKTTFVNQLTGVLRPSAGTILLGGEDITALAPEQRVRRGLVRTFQINQLFASLTPLETLGVAVSERMNHGHDFWRPAGTRADVMSAIEAVAERFRLSDVLSQRTANLPYGKQRLLEIAVAFACNPKVLLLDEPAAGVPEAKRQELLRTISDLPADVSVLLIEHDMDMVFSFAERISVLVNGALLKTGTVADIAADAEVRAVYLGEGADG